MSRERASQNFASVLRSRFGRRLLTAFVGAALLPILLLAAFSIRSVTDRLREQADRDLHTATKEAGMALAERLIQLEADLEVAGVLWLEFDEHGNDQRIDLLPPTLRQRFTERFEDTEVTDAIASSESDRIRTHLAAGKTWVRTSGQEIQMIRAFGVDGRLIAKVRPEAIWGSTGVRPVTGHLAVVDQSGLVLHRSTPEIPDSFYGRHATSPGALSATVENPGSDESIDVLGRAWQLFLVPRFGLSWTLVHTRPEAEVLAPLVGARNLLLGTAILTFLIVSLLSFHHARRVLDPILALRRSTRAVGEGDLQVRLGLARKDEIGALADSFDQMVHDLRTEIARRTQVEGELREARDDALESIRAQSAFLTNVSHEFRTPVSGILASSELLRDFAAEDPDACVEFSSAIHQEAVHLTHLIEDAMALSGGDSKGLEISLSPLDLEGPLRAAIVTHGAEDRVRTSIAEGFPRILGDTRQLTRLFGRLIDNAIKFSPAGSPIDIRATRGACGVEIRVQDEGPGIAEEHHEAIFERFVQVGRDQRTEKAPGVGIGLALARRIAEAHGGSITVESTLGSGACFVVALQTAREPEPAQ